jgi:23S rRNA pseudouridine2605 synthase
MMGAETPAGAALNRLAAPLPRARLWRSARSLLDKARKGMEIEGVQYGPMEIAVERQQGDNQWLTVGLREGKNREVKVVLGALGLQVNRLIRISYGPFQLGELEPGAAQEVRTRILKDQLSGKVFKDAGLDFDGPMRTPVVGRDTPARPDKPAKTGRGGSGNAPLRKGSSGKPTPADPNAASPGLFRGPARPGKAAAMPVARAGPAVAAHKRRAAGRRACESSAARSKVAPSKRHQARRCARRQIGRAKRCSTSSRTMTSCSPRAGP